jgi:hypothetical protein
MPPAFRRHAGGEHTGRNPTDRGKPGSCASRLMAWRCPVNTRATCPELSLPNVRGTPLADIRQHGSAFGSGGTPPKYTDNNPVFAPYNLLITIFRVFILNYLPFAQRLSHHDRFFHLEPDMVAMP